MKSLLKTVQAHPLWSTATTLAAALVLVAAFAFVSPVRIQVNVTGGGAVQAAPVANIPTATPAPPPPTATPVPPTVTSAPPTATPPPPLTQLTPTPIPSTAVPTSSSVPTDEPPTPTDEPPTPTDEPPGEHRRPSPTPAPSATVPPSPTSPPLVPPDVQIAKTSTKQRVRRGEEFDYVIEGRNAGGSTASDVVITDSMPAPLEILSVSSTKGDYEVKGQSITVYPRTLAPGETVRIVVHVRVRADAPPGEVRNLALIFTSTPGDPPPNRTDTPVEILPPAPPAENAPPATVTTQQPPPRLPVTADPDEDMAFLIQYLPLIALAVVLFLVGVAAHYGAFRSRFVRVQIGYASAGRTAAPRSQETTPAATRQATITLHQVELAADPDELYARWRAGETVSQLTAELATRHPAVSKTQIAMVVQQLITERQKA